MKTSSVKRKDQALWASCKPPRQSGISPFFWIGVHEWQHLETSKLIYHRHWNTFPGVISKFLQRKIWTFRILVIAKLNFRETVLKQENAKHNSRQNKLVYIAADIDCFFITRVVFRNILLIVRLTYPIDFVNTYALDFPF
jgi:hypothetical protein